MSVSTLIGELYSNDRAARILAIRSLGQLGTDAATAIRDLVEIVDDPDKDIAALSLRAVAVIGPDRSLKSKLVGLLRDSCPRMRQMAAFAIGALGEDASEAVPSLASMLKDEDRSVQMQAMLALSRVAGPQK